MAQSSLKTSKEEIINYVGVKQLHLETADYRLYRQPYGPAYPEAVGMVFRWSHTEMGDAADADVAYVKSISRDIFGEGIRGERTGETVPIKVYHQLEHEDGLVLLARIGHDHCKCFNCALHKIDSGKADCKKGDNWLVIILYPKSASRMCIS